MCLFGGVSGGLKLMENENGGRGWLNYYQACVELMAVGLATNKTKWKMDRVVGKGAARRRLFGQLPRRPIVLDGSQS